MPESRTIRFVESLNEGQAGIRFCEFEAGGRHREYPSPPKLLIEDELNTHISERFLNYCRHPYREGVHEFENANVFDNWGLITLASGSISPNLLTGFGWNKDHISHLQAKGYLDPTKEFGVYSQNYNIERRVNLSGKTLLLSFPGGLTFGHWFFDVSGRYLSIPETLRASIDNVLMPGPWSGWMDRFLTVLNIPRERIVLLDKSTSYCVEQLYVPSVPSQAPGSVVSYSVMKKIHTAFTNLYEQWTMSSNPAKCDVLLLRHVPMTSDSSRLLSNFSSVEEKLRAGGYRVSVCDPLSQSFGDTLRQIQGAGFCVGQDSSVLHNLICVPKKLLIIETEKRRNLLHMCVQATSGKEVAYIDAVQADGKWEASESYIESIVKQVI